VAATKVCFFITPIGHPNSDVRNRADKIQKYILNEVMAGKYKVLRADALPQPGSISHQVIKWLHEADLVVADLTGANPNVIYELAIRHSFNRVSIHLINKAETIPFDLKDERTIIFDIEDLDSIDGCKRELAKNLKEIGRRGFNYSSPVFRVLGVEAATQEEREEFLETMADKIESIATDVSSIETGVALIDLSDVEKEINEMAKEIYNIKMDIRKLLDK
jgi:hypothetical protein